MVALLECVQALLQPEIRRPAPSSSRVRIGASEKLPCSAMARMAATPARIELARDPIHPAAEKARSTSSRDPKNSRFTRSIGCRCRFEYDQ